MKEFFHSILFLEAFLSYAKFHESEKSFQRESKMTELKIRQ